MIGLRERNRFPPGQESDEDNRRSEKSNSRSDVVTHCAAPII